MLAIRMQRTGRKGHAMFRVVVQDSHRTPTSGKVVAFLGSYDPHTKAITLAKDKAQFYLDHGAQPSGRVTGLLRSEGVKLPDWVQPPVKKERAVRNAEKRRSTAPEKPAEEVATEAPAEEVVEETAAETAIEETSVAEVPETTGEAPAEAAATETETEEKAEPEAPTEPEAPAETPKA